METRSIKQCWLNDGRYTQYVTNLQLDLFRTQEEMIMRQLTKTLKRIPGLQDMKKVVMSKHPPSPDYMMKTTLLYENVQIGIMVTVVDKFTLKCEMYDIGYNAALAEIQRVPKTSSQDNGSPW